MRILSIGLALAAIVGTAVMAQAPVPAAKPALPPSAAPATSAPAADAVPAPSASRGEAMEGLAAYYANRFNGRKTASGQIFSQDKLTAAHPSLPFGTQVKVINTKNDRSVVVRINDRGPTQAGRVIDLSRSAAGKIGMLRSGLAPVRLEIVAEAPARKVGK